MRKKSTRPVLAAMGLFFTLTVFATAPVIFTVQAQIPTVDIPTVTSSPAGVMMTVRPDTGQQQINVRSGPGMLYDKVGVMLIGQRASVLGRSPGGEWVMIDYPAVSGNTAWVYSHYVNLSPGDLPVIEPPPTPTPLTTATIDPTMAAQFVIPPEATRLPTYTPPAPLAIPTFQPLTPANVAAGVPMGLVVIGLLSVGVVLGLFALAQGR